MIASKEQVLSALSEVLTRPDPEGKNLSAICRAAEILGKHMGLFESEGPTNMEPPVIIDDIPNLEGIEGGQKAGKKRP